MSPQLCPVLIMQPAWKNWEKYNVCHCVCEVFPLLGLPPVWDLFLPLSLGEQGSDREYWVNHMQADKDLRFTFLQGVDIWKQELAPNKGGYNHWRRDGVFWHFPKSECIHSLGQASFSVLNITFEVEISGGPEPYKASLYLMTPYSLLRECTPFVQFHLSFSSLPPSVHSLPFHIWADIASLNAGSWGGSGERVFPQSPLLLCSGSFCATPGRGEVVNENSVLVFSVALTADILFLEHIKQWAGTGLNWDFLQKICKYHIYLLQWCEICLSEANGWTMSNEISLGFRTALISYFWFSSPNSNNSLNILIV